MKPGSLATITPSHPRSLWPFALSNSIVLILAHSSNNTVKVLTPEGKITWLFESRLTPYEPR